MVRKSRRKIKVEYTKLGKNRVWGYALLDKNTVQIDERVDGKKHLEILIHECLHILLPELSEEAIVNKSVVLTNTLWNEHYRKVDNSNKIKLQDGKR